MTGLLTWTASWRACRTTAFNLLILGAALSGPAPSAAQAASTFAGTTVIESSGATLTPVDLPADVRFQSSRAGEIVHFDGNTKIRLVVLRQASPLPFGGEKPRWLMVVDNDAPFQPLTAGWYAEGPSGKTLRAGRWWLYVVTDAPARLTIRFRELNGTSALTPRVPLTQAEVKQVPVLRELPETMTFGTQVRIGSSSLVWDRFRVDHGLGGAVTDANVASTWVKCVYDGVAPPPDPLAYTVACPSETSSDPQVLTGVFLGPQGAGEWHSIRGPYEGKDWYLGGTFHTAGLGSLTKPAVSWDLAVLPMDPPANADLSLPGDVPTPSYGGNPGEPVPDGQPQGDAAAAPAIVIKPIHPRRGARRGKLRLRVVARSPVTALTVEVHRLGHAGRLARARRRSLRRGGTVSLVLRSPLRPGRYVVSATARAADGSHVEDELDFRVR